MTVVLFSSTDKDWETFGEALDTAFRQASLDVTLLRDAEPESVDYIIYAPNKTLTDFTPFTKAKAVLSLWAGVDWIVTNPSLTLPIARMVDPGMTEGMVEYCVGHALRYHLGMDADICSKGTTWTPRVPPLARDRIVSVLGLGALGGAVATCLASLNFDVRGWSRTEKRVPGVTCLNGDAGLRDAVSAADIVILLLPRTAATENIVDATLLSWANPGVRLINAGRGHLIDDEALMDSIEDGRVAHATLDVFRREPLAEDHPFWASPSVTVTPHIASATRADSAAGVIAENIRRGVAGEPMLHLVDRAKGY